ncbi:hypothetical protein [Microlunatus sp. Gsoil 973]|uniref:hypothetical protein n=1 Tax=Microlunatus sp. Gsoil 973 TaxID=2672569 RepID=UPI0012B4B50E|nr:hypothetical protein [Microlunatus sp. Gsoil 973]QGN33664.1 hypothetical protein GJV80_13550 [Microlunatus sp. Gsoil 973]
MIRRGRTIAAVLISCAALAACSSAGSSDSPTAPSTPIATAPVSKAPIPNGSGTPSAERPERPQPGEVLLGDLNTKSFRYAGGCGFEVPAPPVRLVDGKQAGRTPGFGGRSSTAEWAGSREVALGDRKFLVVRLRCTVGRERLVAAHLIGLAGQTPTDLGIIATGSRIAIRPDHDQLEVRADYRRIGDSPSHPRGHTSYAIRVAGLTPVRLFSGQQPDDIDPAIANLPARGYDAGLVGVSGYVDDPSETSWVVGLLDRPGRVLTAESLGGGYGSGICWKPTVFTQAGEKIGHDHLAYNGADNGTGTAIDLAAPSKATIGVRGVIDFPVEKNTPGLLIPANGVVPALATATTMTAANGQGDALVTTEAPADGSLDIERFGAASGSEYQLPVGAFATIDGRLAMTGAWYNTPINKPGAAFGMRPVVDPKDLGEKTC